MGRKFFISLSIMVYVVLVASGECVVAQGAPSIGSVSGAVAHGESVSISGSGFGSKTQAAPVIWDDAESGDISDNWDALAPSGCTDSDSDIHYDTTAGLGQGVAQAHGNSTYYIVGRHDIEGTNPWNAYKGPNVLVGKLVTGSAYSYISYYYRHDPNWGGGVGNYKLGRMSDAWMTASSPYFYYEYSHPPITDWRWHTSKGWYTDNDDDQVDPSDGWYKIEILCYHDTSSGWMSVYEDGNLQLSTGNSYSGYPDYTWIGNTGDTGYDHVVIGGFGGRDPGQGGYEEGWENDFRYFDDIYYDNTLARVIIGNAPTLDSSTIREIQIPTAWSEGSITFTANQGSFQNGETAYLFVVDENGTVNEEGYEITIGQAPQGPHISSAPENLSHGESITISGFGFGTKSIAAPLVWDDCESGSVTDNWDAVYPNSCTLSISNMHYDTTAGLGQSVAQSHSHSQRYAVGRCDIEGDGLCNTHNAGKGVNVLLGKLITGSTYSYRSYYYRHDPDWSMGVKNYKLNRESDAWMEATSPYYYYTYAQESTQNGNWHWQTSKGWYVDENGSDPAEGWIKVELLIYHDTSNGWVDIYENGNLIDCYQEWRVYKGYPNHTFANVNTGDSGYDHLVFGGFCQRQNQPISVCDTWEDDFRYFDDIYYDNTLQRVIIGNAPTLASSTIREIQIPQTWSDGSITVDINQGTFANGETAYLFVVDENNVASAGYTISFGGTPTYECSDSIDNDGDGATDYPADVGCTSSTDNDESNCGDGICEGGEVCGITNVFPECNSDCPTGSGQICCSGNLYTGDCCDNSDCSGTETCVSHVCTPQNIIVSVDSTYSGYSTTVIDDEIIDPYGGTATTWASGQSSTSPHWVAINFSQLRDISNVTIYWAFNNYQGRFMSSQEVWVQYWNGSGYANASVIMNSGEAQSSVTTFPVATTTSLRLWQPPDMGYVNYSTVIWLTEIDYSLQNFHRADTDQDGCITMNELIAFIDRWKVDSQDVPMRDMMGAVGLWKSGAGCT